MTSEVKSLDVHDALDVRDAKGACWALNAPLGTQQASQASQASNIRTVKLAKFPNAIINFPGLQLSLEMDKQSLSKFEFFSTLFTTGVGHNHDDIYEMSNPGVSTSTIIAFFKAIVYNVKMQISVEMQTDFFILLHMWLCDTKLVCDIFRNYLFTVIKIVEKEVDVKLWNSIDNTLGKFYPLYQRSLREQIAILMAKKIATKGGVVSTYRNAKNSYETNVANEEFMKLIEAIGDLNYVHLVMLEMASVRA